VSEDPRIDLITNAIEAFNRGDVPGLLEMIDPRVESRVAEGLGNPGSYEGIEGYMQMMSEWAEAWSENNLDLREIELVDERAALVHTDQTAVGAGSGVSLEFNTVFLVVFEGERAIRFEIHPSRDSAIAAL
jgi:ketosteroid isomerase-like protein